MSSVKHALAAVEAIIENDPAFDAGSFAGVAIRGQLLVFPVAMCCMFRVAQ